MAFDRSQWLQRIQPDDKGTDPLLWSPIAQCSGCGLQRMRWDASCPECGGTEHVVNEREKSIRDDVAIDQQLDNIMREIRGSYQSDSTNPQGSDSEWHRRLAHLGTNVKGEGEQGLAHLDTPVKSGTPNSDSSCCSTCRLCSH